MSRVINIKYIGITRILCGLCKSQYYVGHDVCVQICTYTHVGCACAVLSDVSTSRVKNERLFNILCYRRCELCEKKNGENVVVDILPIFNDFDLWLHTHIHMYNIIYIHSLTYYSIRYLYISPAASSNYLKACIFKSPSNMNKKKNAQHIISYQTRL